MFSRERRASATKRRRPLYAKLIRRIDRAQKAALLAV
jgi:hypothetical protein